MTFGVHLAIAVQVAALNAGPAPRYEPDREPRSVEELYLVYRYYGLPLPPTDAVLVQWVHVRFVTTSSSRDGRKVERVENPIPIFRHRKPDSTGRPVFETALGDREYRVPARSQLSNPTPRSLEAIDHYSEFWMSLAARAFHLGHDDLAWAAFKRGQAARISNNYPWFDDERGHALAAVRKIAWQRAYDDLRKPGSDWREVRRRLRLVFDSDARFRDGHNTALLRSLDLALKPGRVRPGSIEALIDLLVESRHGRDNWPRLGEPPDAYDRLIERGFEAVPLLIEHFSDERLTRTSELAGFNLSAWIYILRVGELCQAIISRFSDGETEVYEEDPPPDAHVKKARSWFAEVQKLGEERWAVERATPGFDGFYNQSALRIVRAKFPKHLPRLYRKELEASPVYGSDFYADEVARSNLPRETRVQLLREGAQSTAESHRFAAIHALERLDRVAFLNELRSTLEWLATERQGRPLVGEYLGDYRLLPLVARADDDACWKALNHLVNELDAMLRIRGIDRAFDIDEARDRKVRNRLLRFVSAHLDDRNILEWLNKETGYYIPVLVSHGYSKLTVGDFAALTLASHLGDPIPWKPDRTAEEWAQVRESVRKRVDMELGQDK